MPNLVTDLHWKPLFKFDMWFGVAPRTDTEVDMCLKQIGLLAENMITILGSIVNIMGETCMTI